MILYFNITIVGVGKIFPGVDKMIFPGGGKSGEISFYPLQTNDTKKTTFFATNVMGNCQILITTITIICS